MKIELKELRKRDKYISEKPEGDLILWTYKPDCQYDKAWDKYTSMCRGLITDKEGNIIARPFKKFFNLNEMEETKLENLPNEIPFITEKMDGSLGIQYYKDGKIMIATRGSLSTSEQSQWATEWINKNYKISDFKEGYTYLYEIIYPENRIVIDYNGISALFLLAVKNNETGEELNLIEEAERLKIAIPIIFKDKSLSQIIGSLNILSGNEEGYVFQYSKGLRVKMKGEEYKRLHAILTEFSSKNIWLIVKEGKSVVEAIGKVPDEFYDWVKKIEDDITKKFSVFMLSAKEIHRGIKCLPTRKEQALAIKERTSILQGIIFALLDNQEEKAKEIAWKLCKPKYEQPFKKDT